MIFLLKYNKKHINIYKILLLVITVIKVKILIPLIPVRKIITNRVPCIFQLCYGAATWRHFHKVYHLKPIAQSFPQHDRQISTTNCQITPSVNVLSTYYYKILQQYGIPTSTKSCKMLFAAIYFKLLCIHMQTKANNTTVT